MDWKKFLILPHPLTNFRILKYHQNELIFNGVFWRDNLRNKIKNGAYVINLDEYADVGTHWFALFCTEIEVIYFGSFGEEHIPKKLKNSLEIKIKKVTYLKYNQAIQQCLHAFALDSSILCLQIKNWLILFSPYDFRKITV